MNEEEEEEEVKHANVEEEIDRLFALERYVHSDELEDRRRVRRHRFVLDPAVRRREQQHAIPIHIERMYLGRKMRFGDKRDESWSVFARDDKLRINRGRKKANNEEKFAKRIDFLRQSFEARMRQEREDADARLRKALIEQEKRLRKEFDQERDMLVQNNAPEGTVPGSAKDVLDAIRRLSDRVEERDGRVQTSLQTLVNRSASTLTSLSALTALAREKKSNTARIDENSGYVIFLVENEDVHVEGSHSMVRISIDRAKEVLSSETSAFDEKSDSV